MCCVDEEMRGPGADDFAGNSSRRQRRLRAKKATVARWPRE